MGRVNTYNGVKYLLNKEMKRGRLLDTTNIPRGIGKSKILLDIALENDYVIVVDLKTVATELSKEFNIEDKGVYVTYRDLKDKDVKCILLEEGLTPKQEKKLRAEYNVVGGYSNDR